MALRKPTLRELELKQILQQHKTLFEINVGVGECKKCPLKPNDKGEGCPFYNTTDTSCRATKVASEQFMNHARKSPLVTREDAFGVRGLATIYASLVIAELYFQRFGSVEVRKGKLTFSDLHRQYTRLQAQFMEGLDRYGLSPMGRKVLNTFGDRQNQSAFSKYIDAQYTVEPVDDGSQKEAQHSGLLPRPATVEPTPSRHPRGLAAANLPVADEQEPLGSVEGDDGLEGGRDNPDDESPEAETPPRRSPNSGGSIWQDDVSFGDFGV